MGPGRRQRGANPTIRALRALEATITRRLGQRSAQTPATVPSTMAGMVLATKMPVASSVMTWVRVLTSHP